MPANYDLFYDVIDEACMLLYEELNLNYLDGLIRVSNDILDGIDDSRLEEAKVKKLEAIYNKLEGHTFSNEDIRLAFNLLLIKGLKHASYRLDILIPDSIGLIFASIIRKFYEAFPSINMLEVNAKTANLTNTIANFLDLDIYCFAQEEDAKLASIIKAFSNLQDRNIVVYNNNILDPLEISADVIIGHLSSLVKDDKYIPYKAASKLMRYLEEDGLFIFLIDNDFFSYPDLNEFRNSFTGTLLGLLMLPESMFSSTITKSILIGSKKQIADFEMLVVNMPSLNDQEKMKEMMAKIENWIGDVRLIINEN